MVLLANPILGQSSDGELRPKPHSVSGSRRLHQKLEWRTGTLSATDACSGCLLGRDSSKVHDLSGVEPTQFGLWNQSGSDSELSTLTVKVDAGSRRW